VGKRACVDTNYCDVCGVHYHCRLIHDQRCRDPTLVTCEVCTMKHPAGAPPHCCLEDLKVYVLSIREITLMMHRVVDARSKLPQ